MSHTQSQACCNTPAVVGKGYKEKGEYTNVAGLKTYATGPSSKSGILFVYDIFGYFPQTLQGADILSGLHHSEDDRKFKVFMPDFFEGKPADISWYPPDNDEKGKKLGEFFNTQAAPPKTIENIGKIMTELKEKNPDIQQWGIVGFCWGGKIVNLVSQQGTVFSSAATCHPAMVDPADASKIAIPILSIPSKDEDKEAHDKYEAALNVKNRVEWFNKDIHGFMAARSNLENDSERASYEQAYSILSDWFKETLGDKSKL